MNWTIVNGEERSAQFPDTFLMPADHDRKNLEVGDFAMICLEGKKLSERFWMEVIGHTDDGRYVGAVNNDLVVYHEYKVGHELTFGPEHVLALMPGAA